MMAVASADADSASNSVAPRAVEVADASSTSERERVAALAEQARSGCRESFAALVDIFGERVFNYLWRMTGNRHDAEDLTQDTFVKAFRMLHRYRVSLAFKGWLFTIARRTALNHFRRSRSTQELMPEDSVTLKDPARMTALQEDWDFVWEQARALRREQYEALWLRYAEELSTDEIARVLGLNGIHVRVLIHRGRQLLLKRLEAHGCRRLAHGAPSEPANSLPT